MQRLGIAEADGLNMSYLRAACGVNDKRAWQPGAAVHLQRCSVGVDLESAKWITTHDIRRTHEQRSLTLHCDCGYSSSRRASVGDSLQKSDEKQEPDRLRQGSAIPYLVRAVNAAEG